MLVEAQVTIAGTQAAAWAAITNIRGAADIITGVKKIEIVEEPATGLVGLKWRETRLYFGESATVEKRITRADDGAFYETRAEMDGFVFITTMTVSEAGGSIRLTSTHETQAQGIVAKLKSLPMVFFRGVLKKAILQDLTDIKRAVERR
ncbi:MAG: SRPBCC family protein [Anaeromyxobacter sp.]